MPDPSPSPSVTCLLDVVILSVGQSRTACHLSCKRWLHLVGASHSRPQLLFCDSLLSPCMTNIDKRLPDNDDLRRKTKAHCHLRKPRRQAKPPGQGMKNHFTRSARLDPLISRKALSTPLHTPLPRGHHHFPFAAPCPTQHRRSASPGQIQPRHPTASHEMGP